VIYYRRPTNFEHQEVPSELDGFVDLSGTELAVCHSFGDFHIVGVCDPLLWRPPTDNAAWADGPEGWQVLADDRAPHSGMILRQSAWCQVRIVLAADSKPWAAPAILGATGTRAFPVRYAGREFLPVPTPDQANAITIATEARTLLDGSRQSIDSAVLMPWAAWLMTLTTHLSVDTIAVLGLLDEHLAMRMVRSSAGLDLALPSDDGPG